MRTSSVFLSAFHFIQAVFLIMMGIFFLGIAKVPHMKYSFWKFFESSSNIFLILGISLIIVGFLLFIIMYNLYKKIFYQVRISQSKIEVDPQLIRSYVDSCFTKVLPNVKTSCDIHIKKDQTIEILAKIPMINFEDHEKALSDLEKTIGSLLKSKLGYEKDFFITVAVE